MKTKFLKMLTAIAAMAVVSCGGGGSTAAKTEGSTGSASRSAPTSGGSLHGAGATLPAPLYSQWADAYRSSRGVEVNYAAIGSGGGIRQIQSRTVDFGATDNPLKTEELEKGGLAQFPAAMGGVVLAVNLPDFSGEIKLDGPTVADIFLGKEKKKWNDSRIAGMNPGAKLPDLAVTPVYRSESSGTSFIFTTYLSEVSPTWKSNIGADMAVQWPAGVGGKGNAGVAGFIKQIPGAIGYVEYSFASSNSLPMVTLKNAAGQFVRPNSESFTAAAANANWDAAKDFYLILTNQPGDGSWPIVGVTFILVARQPQDPARVRQVLDFFDYAFKNGQDAASRLGYVPLPSKVTDKIRQSWAAIKGPDGQPVWM